MTLTRNQQLAVDVAIARGAYLPIVMATIEAETNFRNVLGEYAAPTAVWGAGFGQVHLRWHLETFRQVAAELGVAIPAGLTTERDSVMRHVIDDIILRNDLLSMHLAVAVIDRKWRTAGANWERFTRSYVGAGIPDRDLERRRRIWQRWKAFDFSAIQPTPEREYVSPDAHIPLLADALPDAIKKESLIMFGVAFLLFVAMINQARDVLAD